jgi:hypothetical protein
MELALLQAQLELAPAAVAPTVAPEAQVDLEL